MANADEKAREKVYSLRAAKGMRLSEAEVRKALRGSKSNPKKSSPRAIDQRLKEKDIVITELKKTIAKLKIENKRLVDSLLLSKQNQSF